jgi:hypothetical protein
MAVSYIFALQSRSGTRYTFTLESSVVYVLDTRDAAKRQCFTLPSGAAASFSVTEWESGLLEATYADSIGAPKHVYSEDSGKTWSAT